MKVRGDAQGLGNTLSFRISFSVIALIVFAELIAGAIWLQSIKQSRTDDINRAINDIVDTAAGTVDYFRSLPNNYRHLVLNQLLETGGSRFFISLNDRHIPNKNSRDTEVNELAVRYAREHLNRLLGNEMRTVVNITSRDEVRVFNTGIRLDEVPKLWTKYSMALGDFDLPVLIFQMEISEGEWLYLATTLPVPYSYFASSVLEPRQYLFLVIASVLLMAFTARVIRRELKPIRSLARAATLMSARLTVDEIPEDGAGELRSAVHAFNKMNKRIQRYIEDRETLFSALSHDIRTPLACLKLRADMLEDDDTRIRFEKLLNDMDMMLKNALQCIRDTDIHEEVEPLDLAMLLKQCAREYNQEKQRVIFDMPDSLPYLAKPLALRRCLMNVIDNGVKYGERLAISAMATPSVYTIDIHDAGPGIDDRLLEKVFEPYFRARPDQGMGSGLGLTISRSIARVHGGDLVVFNHPEGGLVARVTLARSR